MTNQAGLAMPNAIAVACSFADTIDNDGLPDLFVTTVRHGESALQKPRRWEVIANIPKRQEWDTSATPRARCSFDYDGDGLLDLFRDECGSLHQQRAGPGGFFVGLPDAFMGHLHPERAEASILYHNLGGGRFKDVTREVGLVNKSWSRRRHGVRHQPRRVSRPLHPRHAGWDHLWLNEGGKHFSRREAN